MIYTIYFSDISMAPSSALNVALNVAINSSLLHKIAVETSLVLFEEHTHGWFTDLSRCSTQQQPLP